jgi:hypothetical protein
LIGVVHGYCGRANFSRGAGSARFDLDEAQDDVAVAFAWAAQVAQLEQGARLLAM